MELKILQSRPTIKELQEYIELYFDSKIKIDRIDLSIFEQYRLYPGGKKHIPKIWSYRIVAKNGNYHFGINTL